MRQRKFLIRNRSMQNSITSFNWFSWLFFFFFGALHVNFYFDKDRGLNVCLDVCVEEFPRGLDSVTPEVLSL